VGGFLIAHAVPVGYVSVVGPVAITFLLVRVSGVRMLERGLKERRPGHKAYVRRTSAFAPRPPPRRGGDDTSSIGRDEGRLEVRPLLSYRLPKEATVTNELQRVLDFAIEKEREAEAFYKEWAAKVRNPAVVALFAELAATEHGHAEMLAHLTLDDLGEQAAAGTGDLGLSDRLVDVEASEGMGVQEAMVLAMKREEAAAALYDELARLGGETQSLFEALAAEERTHKGRLETEYDEQVLTEN